MTARRTQLLTQLGIECRGIVPEAVYAVRDDVQQVARVVQRLDEPVANVALESERSRFRDGVEKAHGDASEEGRARLEALHAC